MKKSTRTITNVCLGVFLALPGLIAAPAMAEVIEWNGETDVLQNIDYTIPGQTPEQLADTLAPRTGSSSNTVTANSGQVGNILGGFAETGNASSNTVTVNAGVEVTESVYGGFAVSGDATSNSVTVNTGSQLNMNVYGGASFQGNANGNQVTAYLNDMCCGVTGGYAPVGDANNNSVTAYVTGSISLIYGGQSNFDAVDSVAGSMGQTSNNSVRVVINASDNDLASYLIRGGYVNYGSADNNVIDISLSGGMGLSDVIGGESQSGGTTNRNIVKLSVSDGNGQYIDMIRGGQSYESEANDNVVTISLSDMEGSALGSITGGQSGGDGTANNNSVGVSFSGGDALYVDGVTGGESAQGDANGNSVDISMTGGNDLSVGMRGSVIGGSSGADGTANNNSVAVSFSGGDGLGVNSVTGGESAQGDANGNSVDISMTGGEGLTISTIRGGDASNGFGNANNNTVTVFQSGSSVLSIGGITGGLSGDGGNANNNSVNITQIGGDSTNIGGAYGGVSSDGEANSNAVHVETTGHAFDVIGGQGDAGASNNLVYVKADQGGDYIRGGYSLDGNADNNTVTVILGAGDDTSDGIYGGYSDAGSANGNAVTVLDSVIGGDPDYSRISGGYSGSGSANGNNVIVRDSSIAVNVVGGYSDGDTGAETAHNNTVTLEGATNITGGVYGGYIENSAYVYSGNTLNVWNYTGTTKTELIANFENFNFIVPASITNGGTVISTVDIDYGSSATITGLELAAGAPVFRVGDHIVLIQADAHEAGNTVTTQQVSGSDGGFMAYDWSVGQEDSNLVARLLGAGVDQDRARPLSQTRLAGLAFLADNDLEIERPAKPGLTPFLLTKGGWMRHNTGSHIDINGFHMMGGVSWNDQVDFGNVMVAAFLEGGWGDFDTSTSAHSGDGETSYFGGGLMGRIDFADTGPGNFYTEASFRGGHASIDLNGSDLFDSFGQQATFETDSFYLKAHAGLGYIWSVNEVSSFDFYGKYTWTHLGSDDVTVMGSSVNFDSMDSHRIRIGTRYKQDVVLANDMVLKPYVGAAFEHEFDAESEGSINGYRMDNVDLTGSSMMSEIGLSFSPSVESNLHVELGVQGFLGQREGIDGQFRIKYTF